MEPLWPLSHSLSRGGQPFRPLHEFRPLILPSPFSWTLDMSSGTQGQWDNSYSEHLCGFFPDILGVLKPLALTFLFPSHLGYMFSLVPTGKPETGPSNQLLERC